MTTKRASTAARGFTLLEVLIASAISLVVITAAVMVGVQLQRRGYMEERTVETQNAARAARDLMASSIQRAGAGAGTLPLAVGTTGAGTADLRYSVWPTTGAASVDGGAGLPTGRYAGLVSDGLEVWETDPGRLVPLAVCSGTSARWVGSKLCTSVAPPADLVGRVVAVVAPEPPARAVACAGVISAVDTTKNPPGDNDFGVEWTPGLPGNPLPAGHPCESLPGNPAGTIWASTDLYLMPLSARSFRVTWSGDQPALEMDPDGFAGPQGFSVVSQEIEQLQVRVGVVPLGTTDGGVLYFPDTAAARPALDQCTDASCRSLVTWDAGVAMTGDEGPGSARDVLMSQVRMVELEITARSQRLDMEALTTDGGVDEDGNLQDGYKRRHTIIRLAPRNFGYSGF